jgi:putative transposase
MIRSGYRWRRLSQEERDHLLQWRQTHLRPWHSPPHWSEAQGDHSFHVTAACWEHLPRIGHSLHRLSHFTEALLHTAAAHADQVVAWCVLPNHYHLLVRTSDLRRLVRAFGQFHGRTSRAWNVEEGTIGRANFYRCTDRAMRSAAHVGCTINYIHHNPVHHGYVTKWGDWPWSSAHQWLETHGPDEMLRMWKQHPLLDYGCGWDDAEL